MAVVFHQYPNHLSGWYYVAVVVFYGLELTYVTDASYGRPTTVRIRLVIMPIESNIASACSSSNL